MNKIDELIKERCQNGVEYKTLGDICKIETGKLNANAAVEDGEYLFFTTAKEVSHIDTYRWDTEALLIAGNANIGDVKHYVGKFDAYQRTYVLTDFNNTILPRFLYFSLKNNLKQYLDSHKNEAAMTYIVLSALQNFKIPVPPLEIQQEIVGVLNSFTELEAELEAELTKRKQQYEHYRDHLLSFENIAGEGQVEWLTLGDIGEVCMCKRILKNQTQDSGIPFFKIGTFGRKEDSYIAPELFEEYKRKYSYPKKGDILISAAGTIGRTVIFDGEPAYFQDSNIVWIDNNEEKVTNKYLYYFYQTKPWRVSSGGTIARIYNNDIRSVKIPVPTKNIQERIVYVLDNFDAVCNDLNIGLPAEIEARQRQYEYYRDRLLSFDVVVGGDIERERERSS